MKTSRIGVLVLVLGMVFTTGCLGIFSKDYTSLVLSLTPKITL